MKTYYLLLFMLVQACLFSAVSQEAIQLPEADKEYKIIHSSALLLTYDLTDSSSSLRAKLKNPSGTDNQVFRFVPVANEDSVYYIQNVASERYLVRSMLENYWSTTWTDDPTVLPVDINQIR